MVEHIILGVVTAFVVWREFGRQDALGVAKDSGYETGLVRGYDDGFGEAAAIIVRESLLAEDTVRMWVKGLTRNEEEAA
jgi:hypothetical protein